VKTGNFGIRFCYDYLGAFFAAASRTLETSHDEFVAVIQPILRISM